MQENILNELSYNGISIQFVEDHNANKLFSEFGQYCLSLLRENELTKLGSVDIRTGPDEGMLDIQINENNLPEFFREIYFQTKDNFELVCAAYLKNKKQVVGKVYINKGVTKTRGAHSDGTIPQLKKFVYCTRVNIEDGPYSYQIRSHNFTIKKIISFVYYKLFSKIDPNTYLFSDQCSPCLGDPGTVLISDQRGLHKGLPQKDSNRSRVVLVFDSGH